MSYDFYELAKNEPDLQDVCEYLKDPLLILDEIFTRLEKSPLKVKTDIQNQQIYLECDKLIHHHFSSLISNYCELSLDYRNTHIIKRERHNQQFIEYTAKDLLLKNLAKLSEEALILSNRFNETNSYHFLVKNRIASDLGVQPTMPGMETEQEVESIHLPNKFDYNLFKKSYHKDFSNIEIKKPEVKEEIQEVEEVASSNSAFSLIEVLLVTGFIALSSTMVYFVYNKMAQKKEVYNKTLLFEQDTLNLLEQKNNSIMPIESFNGSNRFNGRTTLKYDKETNVLVVTNDFIPMNECLIFTKSIPKEFHNYQVNINGQPTTSDNPSVCHGNNNVISVTK